MHFLCSLLQIPAEQWRNDRLAIKLESGRKATEISGDGVGVLSEVQTWLRCPKALSSSMRSTVDWRQAGLRVAAALVTNGSARQANVLLFLPMLSSQPCLFYPPFPLFIHSLVSKTWPPARRWCHGCHGDRSLTATKLCRDGEVSEEGNHGSSM